MGSCSPPAVPFPECPGTIANAGRMVGVRVESAAVLDQLRGTAGGAHLNDALHALAEVPRLVAALTG